ncbi:MAG: methyltransferase domain-containing protein [Candidatus Nanohaloarchaea archaeon]|nr:methyltransferase domain-containing protein [Candidatus Nanohaloarchaea archaeon]
MTSETVRASVNTYYNWSQPLYNLFWGASSHHCMHVGYSESGEDSLEASVENLNAVLADEAGIDEGDRVLDAGCGVGGGSVWLATRRGASVLGININGQQLEQARSYADREGVEDLVSFRLADFTDTGLDSSSFDIVWAVDTVSHTDERRKFFQEAYRLLDESGVLVLTDAFRETDDLDQETRRKLRAVESGLGVQPWEMKADYRQYADDAGFGEITFRDITAEAKPSLERVYRRAKLARPLGVVASLLPLPDTIKDIPASGYYQYQLVNDGILSYQIMTCQVG